MAWNAGIAASHGARYTWEDLDVSTAALDADATYLERIDDAGPLFLPGSVSRRLLRRLT